VSAEAAVKLRRLLALIPPLGDGKAHEIAKVAKLAGTDVNTIFADLYSLSERFGDPGGFVPGLQVWIESASRSVKLRASHFARTMRLTAPELCALDLGLAMLRAERPASEHRAIDGARARLKKALAKLPAAELQNGGAGHHADLGAAGDGEHLAVVRTAMRAHRKVRVVYRNADATESRARVIAPYGLVAANGAWYVVAHCYERNAVRIFRFDRIESATATAETFSVPETFSLDGMTGGGRIFHADEPATLKVRYSPKIARWIAERAGVQLAKDGSLTLEHPLADAQWAVRHVMQYGPDARVVSPSALCNEVFESLHKIQEL
jgi:proteasome accessory factor C